MDTLKLAVFECDSEEEKLFTSLAPGYGINPRIIMSPIDKYNARFAAGCRCASVGHKTKVDGDCLRILKKAGIEYLTTRSVGYDHIDTAAAERLGIGVGNISYSPGSVADYTIMLMLMSLRSIKSVLARGQKNDYSLEKQRGRELSEMTVGVVGTGRIGSELIKRLGPFGCEVLAWDNVKNANVKYTSLEELLEKSDIVSLHVPLTDKTRHLLNGKRISLMKEGAFIINTGRGALIDNGALCAALESGKLGGAALDVIEGEEEFFYKDCSGLELKHPYIKRLQEMENVIITPHSAYYTRKALEDTIENTMLNCLRFTGRAIAN